MEPFVVETKKIYFAVEIVYVYGSRVESGLFRRNAMPTYVCYFGAGAEAQMQEEGCFVITDCNERLWFCREVTPDKREDFAGQLFRMGYLAHKIGIKEPGEMFFGIAENKEDLRDQLDRKE